MTKSERRPSVMTSPMPASLFALYVVLLLEMLPQSAYGYYNVGAFLKGCDPNTVLMLHMDSPNGSTAFVDSSGHKQTITALGNAKSSTAQSKFGGSSAYFDGNSTTTLSITFKPSLAFGSGDFTIDFWVYWVTTTIADFFVLRNSDLTDAFVAYHYPASSSTNYYINASTYVGSQSGNFVLSTGTWTHIAFVRNGSNWYVFKNGALSNSGTNSSSINTTNVNTVYIGGLRGFNGYLDEFRVSNIARWTSNFTPPTRPHCQ